MRFLGVFCFCLSTLFNCTEKNKNYSISEIHIIPRPNSLELNENSFALKSNLTVSVENEKQSDVANFLIKQIENKTKISLQSASEKPETIRFVFSEKLQPEAYQLKVTLDNITISAKNEAGWFYGVQSLGQLITKEHTNTDKTSHKWLIPCVTIEDTPRFKWRAYMLDESRYFHGKAFVKRLLDEMALLKLNVFHWHLIDDAGWRVEIKKYPLLTDIGAYRKDSEIEWWGSGKTSGKPHGGYYTQEDIKDIVNYAKQRQIIVVPEFEMPGHSSAAIASYSWLGTAGKDIDVPVKFGRHFDNYDVTKPKVQQFIKDVLEELFELFPSKVIHVGGDEVGYKVWEESLSVRKYMKDNNFKTPADLQIAFINDVSKFIENNNRRLMGWNEIMGVNIHKGFEEKKHDKNAETQLAKNAIIHFWKGDIDLARQAAKKGYDMVNSLHTNTYLDYDHKKISLEKAYQFNPIPEGLEPKYHHKVLGLGCQMWSEWTPTNADVERQTFPRLAAYAEVGWTTTKNKDFNSFKQALEKIQDRWSKLGINYTKLDE